MGMIPGGIDVGESMSLRISLRRCYTIEVLTRGLKAVVIEVNNRWRKRERGRGGGEGLCMIVTYTHVDKCVGIHLRYLHIM